MDGWRFADRGWFINDALNLRSAANRRAVADELEFPNIVFGLHRWFAGGGNAAHVAIATMEQWDAELARGRPGDNLLLLSLRRVAGRALAHAGEITSHERPVLGRSDIERIGAFLGDDRRDLTVVQRLSPRPGDIRCAARVIPTYPRPSEWDQELADGPWSGGDVWLFDGDLVWRDHAHRQRAPQPPETWTASHGLYVVDGYVPDELGRVVCGGPY
jgi:hypothetical protein